MGKTKAAKSGKSLGEIEQRQAFLNVAAKKTFKRSEMAKLKAEKKKEKRAIRKKRKEAGEKPGVPHTIESLRVPDETVLDANITENEERIEEMNIDIDTDEFQSYFNSEYEPKVLISFSDNPLKKTRIFGVELSRVIPNSLVRYRKRSSVKRMIESAKKKNFTDIVIINENQRQPNGLLVIHLPEGPTIFFRLSNVKITPELKKNYKEISTHRPEVILNNFTTRLGTTCARMLASLFHYDPQFKGRRVVTFHNQRDYIFFRHHRYQFDEKAKPHLKELGPRFTLRLEYIQQGTFDTKLGEYEWVKTGHRHDLESNRRKFHL